MRNRQKRTLYDILGVQLIFICFYSHQCAVCRGRLHFGIASEFFFRKVKNAAKETEGLFVQVPFLKHFLLDEVQAIMRLDGVPVVDSSVHQYPTTDKTGLAFPIDFGIISVPENDF